MCNILVTLAQTINKSCLNLPLYWGWFLGGCSSFLVVLTGLGSDQLDILSSVVVLI